MNLSTSTTLGIWISAFLPAYAFDETFNRQRQIIRLRKLFEINNTDEEPINKVY